MYCSPLLSIEQTKLIYYNFSDTNANFVEELLQKNTFLSCICTIMTIPAYPKRQFSTQNVLAVVIIIFIEFDDLMHFKKICVIIHLCINWDSLTKT